MRPRRPDQLVPHRRFTNSVRYSCFIVLTGPCCFSVASNQFYISLFLLAQDHRCFKLSLLRVHVSMLSLPFLNPAPSFRSASVPCSFFFFSLLSARCFWQLCFSASCHKIFVAPRASSDFFFLLTRFTVAMCCYTIVEQCSFSAMGFC